MLQIQQYLNSGKTLEDLNAELGIKSTHHPELPLVILNYDQIESKPKTHPIVRECRGLVLDSNEWNLVAKSMNRFFNWGEVQDEMGLFDFSNFIAHSKEDGSLVLIYHFNGKWHANTRGSFGLDLMQHQQFSWREGICNALGINSLDDIDPKLDPNICYVCEFVSPWNKIVRRYSSPQLFLLTAFNGKDELHHNDVDHMTHGLFERPVKYQFNGIDEIQEFLKQQASDDPTFEGVVIHDHNGHRFKIKSPTYLGLHRMRGEGDNIFHPKNLLPFVLTGEDDELLTYFSEVADSYYELKRKVDSYYENTLSLWEKHKDIDSQKDFALAVKDDPFSSVLFQVRKKHGKNQTEKDLKNEFLSSETLILKRLLR